MSSEKKKTSVQKTRHIEGSRIKWKKSMSKIKIIPIHQKNYTKLGKKLRKWRDITDGAKFIERKRDLWRRPWWWQVATFSMSEIWRQRVREIHGDERYSLTDDEEYEGRLQTKGKESFVSLQIR